jgi:hypothetical protein
MFRLPALAAPAAATVATQATLDLPAARLDGWVGLSAVALLTAGIVVAELHGADEVPKVPAAPLPREDRWLLAALLLFGGVAVVSLRAAVGVAANELQLFPEAGLAWWRLPFVDVGLPSLVHGWLTAIASGVGGVALITVAHVLLYGALVGLWLRAAREVAGPRTAWAVTAALAASPTLLYQVTELRSYVTFLTCCGVALLALTRRPARVDLAALALVVGALDAPSCLLLLAGVFVARLLALPLPQPGRLLWGGMREGPPEDRWWRAGLALAIGLLPWLLVVRGMHTEAGDLGVLGAPALAPGLLLGALALLAQRRGRPAFAAAGACGLVGGVGLMLGGGLASEPQYLLFVAPFLAVAIAAWTRGEGQFALPDAPVALGIAGAAAGAWTAAVLLPGAASGAWLWCAGAAGGALIGAAWPSAPPLVPVLVLLVASGGAVRARVGWEQEERAAREAALALAKEEAAGSAICAPEAHVAAWLRAAELSAARVDLWSPLRAAEAEPPLQEGCEGAAVVVVSRPERLPPGCARVFEAGWQIGRCAR